MKMIARVLRWLGRLADRIDPPATPQGSGGPGPNPPPNKQ